METILRGLLVMATAGALVLPTAPPKATASAVASRGHAVTAPTAPKVISQSFKADQLEAYLNDDGLAYIRPGLKITVNSVKIGTDRKPVVDLTLTDSFDQPVDRLGKVTPGPIAISFLVAWYNPDIRQYVNYNTKTVAALPTSPKAGSSATQAITDAGGKFADDVTGHTVYTFGNALPAGYDVTKTHTIGIYANRNLNDLIGKYYPANVEYDFRPDGGTVTDKWDKINLAASCNQCHDPLKAHGETGRQEPKLCAMCHQPQTTDPDTGNTVDFKVMIHKIHMGKDLPSVQAGGKYDIIGFGGADLDFSTVAFPQDIRNCATCHEGNNASAKPTQAAVWYTNPSRAACGSCHDDINWTTGANHPAGPMADDTACAKCHVPASGQEFDASIKGAHTNPLKSAQLKGLSFQVVSVANAAAGKKPTVVYAIKNGDGTAVDGTKLSTFAPILAGPTQSYSSYWRENGVAGGTNTNPGVYDATSGNTSYTFTNAIPANATGTWTITADMYRSVTLKKADGSSLPAQREAAFNNIKYVGITDTVPVPRRTSVVIGQCNTCHDMLGLHGGQRMNTQECVICHNPTEGDQARRPATAGAKESVSFSRLIHRIHTGEELTQDFTIYGFGGSKNNFNEVRFPGDRRDCAKCHTATGYTLPLQPGIQTVTTLRDYFSPQGPATASCLGCHDNQDAAAHAYLNTTNFGGTATAEACATCHGNGKDWDVAKVHAR